MSALPVHKCSDPECCSFGQITTKNCGCHKTTEQLLVEQRDELLLVLKSIDDFFEAYRPEDHPPSDPHNIVRAAIAKVEGKS